ncbi:hypothetical protein, partial [Paraclostridium dentum]|uniref:hypothetical protein n=1 Tax=Paraclostridium dentum TaxID=2662455 RepID=UPI003F378129
WDLSASLSLSAAVVFMCTGTHFDFALSHLADAFIQSDLQVRYKAAKSQGSQRMNQQSKVPSEEVF